MTTDSASIDRLHEVTLGALLLNIGKLMQRAEVERRIPSILTDYLDYCTLDEEGNPHHLHAAYTAYFIEHILPDGMVDKTELLKAALRHKSGPDDIYRVADCLSSGMEPQSQDVRSNDSEHDKSNRLRCILEYMAIDKNQSAAGLWRHKLAPLDEAAHNCFAGEAATMQPPEETSLSEQYAALWEGFLTEFKSIATGKVEHFLVSLLGLLEKYTWCVPISSMVRLDVSLYDHAKTTAAIAAALHLHQSNPATDDDIKEFILLAGDLSGIQSYIFNIRNVGVGGTAKRLRARSFFLSILSDIAAHRLLHTFDLSPANQIISSGGKFYLLLPNTADSGQRIDELRTVFDEWLMDNLNGEVALNLATAAFSSKELLCFNQVLRKVNDELNREKNRPFSRYLSASDGWLDNRFIINHAEFDSEERLCKGCGKFRGVLRPAQEVVLCDHCDSDIRLGAELTRAMGVQFAKGKENGWHGVFGYSFSILKSSDQHDSAAYLVSQFNNWSFNRPGAPLKPRYYANYVPKFDRDLCRHCDLRECKEKANAAVGNPKFFTCLAQASSGKKALGVFKADVDNLGLIFINGFGAGSSDKSIARITTLSRLLDTFFTGHLDYLLRTKFKDIYTVYAGGDDLLVLGPWDRVLAFSLKLRKEFQAYCCRNPDITLSAGIAIVKPRLPIYGAVEMAEELLENAKKSPSVKGEEPKDQLAVLGDCFKWEKSESLLAEGDKLAGWQDGKKVSMGFVRQLLYSGEAFKRFKDKQQTSELRFVPMLAYAISRNIRDQQVEKWAYRFTDLSEGLLNNLQFLSNYAIHRQEKKS